METIDLLQVAGGLAKVAEAAIIPLCDGEKSERVRQRLRIYISFK
jgi:hypothetical protein